MASEGTKWQSINLDRAFGNLSQHVLLDCRYCKTAVTRPELKQVNAQL